MRLFGWYIGLCRRHWMAGDLGPDFDINRV